MQPSTSPVPADGRSLLGRALSRRRALWIPGTAILVCWQLCETLVPIAIGLIVDHAIIPRSVPAFAVGIAGVIVLFTVLAWSFRLGARRTNTAIHIETHELRMEVTRAALSPRGVRSGLQTGEVLSVATADADVAATIFRQIGLGGAASIGLLAAAGYLLVTDWLTGVIVLVGVPAGLLVAHLVSPLVTRRSADQQAAVARASAMASDLMSGLRVIKGIGAERGARGRFTAASGAARDAAIRTADGVGRIEGVGALSTFAVLAAVTLVAGWRTTTGDLTIGQLIAVVGVATFTAEPIGTLTFFLAQFARSRAAAQRIVDFLRAEPLLVAGGQQLAGRPAEVVLDLPAGRVHAPAGSLTALVVDDPAEADRIVAALSGDRAAELIEHLSIGAIPRTGLTGHPDLVVAPHEVDIFDGTLGHNCGVDALEAARRDQVLAASATAELLDLFPDGLDHELHAGGRTLSGGQRQRIGLARALAADPRLLVLVDPSTAVDAVTEAEIARGLRTLRHGSDADPNRTTVVLTSSPALCAAADRVVHLAGTMVIGRHDDLLRSRGEYQAVMGR